MTDLETLKLDCVRLVVANAQNPRPIEDVFREAGVLVDFVR
jgi:hypothetical protein